MIHLSSIHANQASRQPDVSINQPDDASGSLSVATQRVASRPIIPTGGETPTDPIDLESGLI